MYISINDLLLGLIIFFTFCIIVVAGIYLIITLNNLNNLFKKANKVISENNENINKTWAVLPDAIKSINEAAISIKVNADKAGKAIDIIDDVVTGTVVSLSDGTETISDFVKAAGNVMNIVSYIISIFRSKE